jgi:Holliday junction DNA helicase RuvB
MPNINSLVQAQSGDEQIDLTLRPKVLTEFIGQEQIKKSLNITIQAAQYRGESLDHILLYGLPGLGKTTLAHIIAKETGSHLLSTSGPAIERPGDLVAILTNLEKGDVLFIDEIHRLNKTIEEVFYGALEDFKIDIMVGKGPGARTLKLDLPHFTLIGATTRLSLISSPLRDRFGLIHRLKFYNNEHIGEIIHRSARILKIGIDKEAADILAKRSRQTPRIANRLLKRVRDFSQVRANDHITKDSTLQALAMLEIDDFGLDEIDRRILTLIIEKFKGGPVGLNTIAAAISEEQETIAEIYEPFLMQIGFLVRTSRGRVVTQDAYRHLGFNIPQARLL